jgi:predicted Rossmann fold flavoprotein
MDPKHVVVVGGGAAGFFAAITCAEARPDLEVTILEKSADFLAKVRVSGGGRCNVTHSCFEARELSAHYPRGERALMSPFKQFQPKDTVAWFAARGIDLKTEADGRMFPVTDSSQTIIDCFLRSAKAAGVKTLVKNGVDRVVRRSEGGFELTLANGQSVACDRLLLATGGCRAVGETSLPAALGHSFEVPVPSLFTFHIENPWLRNLAGVSLETVEASVPGTALREQGALMITHWGLSGPAILRLSAWGARELFECNYKFPLLINWLPKLSMETVEKELQERRRTQPARFVSNTPLAPLSSRLWEALVLASGLAPETRWAAVSKAAQHQLVQQLTRSEFMVTGKSTNKEEFVTCGGVRLGEINLKTMESRICPGLFFAGELLDIDGITGGFNFQAAWTTGWIAGKSMAL